jgi:hypothetical protein
MLVISYQLLVAKWPKSSMGDNSLNYSWESPNFAEGELLQGIQAKIIFSQTNALGTF